MRYHLISRRFYFTLITGEDIRMASCLLLPGYGLCDIIYYKQGSIHISSPRVLCEIKIIIRMENQRSRSPGTAGAGY